MSIQVEFTTSQICHHTKLSNIVTYINRKVISGGQHAECIYKYVNGVLSTWLIPQLVLKSKAAEKQE